MSSYSRREFGKLALGAISGSACISSEGFAAGPGKPDSLFNGVQIGMNVPYSFGAPVMDGDETLKKCLDLGISAVELRMQPVELFLGADPGLISKKKNSKDDGAAKLKDWRKNVAMDKVKEFRRKWEDAGVFIQIVKVDNIFKFSDNEVDYAFNVAKTLGARAISTEISHSDEELKRLGSFADKHQFFVGYHGHATTGPKDWEKAFSFAKFNGANVDIGHFVAGDFGSPVPFITEHHERVTHLHIKDRKIHNGSPMPFGQGDTPIKEVLHLLRDKKWGIQAAIEFEYKVPAGSDRMKELAKCVQYCKDALA